MAEAHISAPFTRNYMIEYFAIALGLLSFGDAVLITATYFALFGHLNLTAILIMSFLASNLMDMVWYYIGKKGLKNRFKSLSFVENYEKNHPKIMETFFNHQLKIIFFSRFLQGAGISMMILSGIYHVPFRKFMAMNLLSSIVVITFVPIVVFFAKTSASAIFDNLKIVEWTVAIIVLLVFLSIKFELRTIVNKVLFFRKNGKENHSESNGNV